MQELKSWEEIFADVNLFNYVRVQERLIYQITRHTPTNGSVLEVGFGTGWTSILLAQLGYHVSGIDIDKRNYEQACLNAKCMGVSINFYNEDLFFGKKTKGTQLFDVGFSDGLFEHFSDLWVIEGLKIMKRCCNTVIVDVPSWKERHAEVKRGDEIYRKNREWKRLIKLAGFRVRKMYGSVFHCPRWYKYLVPRLMGRYFAPYFTTKVGFVI